MPEHEGYIIILENKINEKESNKILETLNMIKGVLKVEPVISDAEFQIAESRIKNKISEALYEFKARYL